MDWNSKEKTKFIRAILALKTTAEAECFLRDLMTEGEIEEFSKRLKAAEMLSQNISYEKIEKETGLSSTTIARVSKWLNGREGGYKLVLKRIK
ncbi:MAG: YerC/YecD family TrpR-related protein [Candidatus Pacebacteria bacterium]|nr:YerC/YecD family TrpR-related protein [Candidatus Paceibacterota bacterium]MDD5356859.1 YerC/YecD family TrpR-related protein [Candidatus Paceibacterota bacterium]